MMINTVKEIVVNVCTVSELTPNTSFNFSAIVPSPKTFCLVNHAAISGITLNLATKVGIPKITLEYIS